VETADDPIKERVLALVVEKTGYPKDMLDLDLDLEADLGLIRLSRPRCLRRSERRTTSHAMKT